MPASRQRAPARVALTLVAAAVISLAASTGAQAATNPLSIAVKVSDRRRGIARKLIEVHLRRLFGYGVSSLFLEVDERNLPARRLYAGFGFVQVGRRNSYYGDGGEEGGAALVLRRDLC